MKGDVLKSLILLIQTNFHDVFFTHTSITFRIRGEKKVRENQKVQKESKTKNSRNDDDKVDAREMMRKEKFLTKGAFNGSQGVGEVCMIKSLKVSQRSEGKLSF
jgi:hypothetical protein